VVGAPEAALVNIIGAAIYPNGISARPVLATCACAVPACAECRRHPTAEWIANQVTEACGWEQAPRYLIRDRDGAYGEVLIRRLRSIGIRDQPTSLRSPWQNGYAERLIGSIRRECLDHVIVFSERHLRHLLLCYMEYYNGTRTHLSWGKMHRSRAPSIAPDTFFVAQSWADSITDMPGFNLRQAHGLSFRQ
jgi:transposase InsO family protein